jgi:hypothetical protein
VKFVPDDDALLRAIPALKESLHINVELAAPIDFIPVRDGWEERSPFITREGPLSFHHFDLVAQALAKVERGHVQDREDVLEMLRRGLVDVAGLWSKPPSGADRRRGRSGCHCRSGSLPH